MITPRFRPRPVGAGVEPYDNPVSLATSVADLPTEAVSHCCQFVGGSMRFFKRLPLVAKLADLAFAWCREQQANPADEAEA